MEQIGYGYDRMEKEGIISPVIEIHAKYRSMTRFGETVNIQVKMVNFTGLKFSLEYIISDSVTGEIRVTGSSEHCLLDRDNKPVRLKKVNPELYALLDSCVEK